MIEQKTHQATNRIFPIYSFFSFKFQYHSNTKRLIILKTISNTQSQDKLQDTAVTYVLN